MSRRLASSPWAVRAALSGMDPPPQPGPDGCPSFSVLVESSQVNSAKGLTGLPREGSWGRESISAADPSEMVM